MPWYWSRSRGARLGRPFRCQATGCGRPLHAADYSATTQWLNAVRTAGTTDAYAVIRALDRHKFNNMCAHGGEFRASDHMVVHYLYIAKVRAPAELPEPHAWYSILTSVPAATAFPAGTECKMAQ